MKANLSIQSFPLCGTALHVTADCSATVLRGEDLGARLRRLPDGLLLGAFQISCDVDTHPQMWEMHPEGDEILVMLTGALEVAYTGEHGSGTCSLEANHGIAMPRGVWHRLELRQPGVLLTLTPLQGTRHSDKPGDHS